MYHKRLSTNLLCHNYNIFTLSPPDSVSEGIKFFFLVPAPFLLSSFVCLFVLSGIVTQYVIMNGWDNFNKTNRGVEYCEHHIS